MKSREFTRPALLSPTHYLAIACVLGFACDAGDGGGAGAEGGADATDGATDGDDGDDEDTGDGEPADSCDGLAAGTHRCADPDASGGADAVSFNEDLVPMFEDNCLAGSYGGEATSCHQPGGIDATSFSIDLDLRPEMAYASLCGDDEVCDRAATKSDEALVVPEAPCESFFWKKLDGCTLEPIDGEGLPMPYLGDRVSQDQIDLVWRWIEQGANP